MRPCIRKGDQLFHPDIKKGYVDVNHIYSFKGRNIDVTKPIRVYRNLNRTGVWYSIRQGSEVVAHSMVVCIRDCKFLVNQKVRRRIITTKKREVHAFIEGFLTGTSTKKNDIPVQVKYNPYIYEHFTTDSGKIVTGARFVICDGKGRKRCITCNQPLIIMLLKKIIDYIDNDNLFLYKVVAIAILVHAVMIVDVLYF